MKFHLGLLVIIHLSECSKTLKQKRGIVWLSKLGSTRFPDFRCGWIQGSSSSFLSSLFSLGLASVASVQQQRSRLWWFFWVLILEKRETLVSVIPLKGPSLAQLRSHAHPMSREAGLHDWQLRHVPRCERDAGRWKGKVTHVHWDGGAWMPSRTAGAVRHF